MPQPHEVQRLDILLKEARQKATYLKTHLTDFSSKINDERTQYFEKLALGSGATIALVVSFVGSRPGRLNPAWLLRASLVSLVLAMISAMFRNWLYPYYTLAATLKQVDEALLVEAECDRNFAVVTDAISLNTGRPIDVQEAEDKFQRLKSALEGKIKEFSGKEKRNYRMLRAVEPITLAFVMLGMVLLVALAWLNF